MNVKELIRRIGILFRVFGILSALTAVACFANDMSHKAGYPMLCAVIGLAVDWLIRGLIADKSPRSSKHSHQ